jgi:positive phototaxis protein PixI
MINARLKPFHITAQVGWKEDCLGVLLEGETVPPQRAMVRFIQQGVEHLQLSQIKSLRIYGRQHRHATPAWREVVEYAVVPDTDGQAFSLIEWLSQGQGSIPIEKTHEMGFAEDLAEECLDLDAAVAAMGSPEAGVLVAESTAEQKFLRFYFNAEATALLPLTAIKEVLKVPVAGILPVPHMPDCIFGLYNCRGEMLWIADLGQQLGFPSSLGRGALPTTLTVIVLQKDAAAVRTLAVMVPQVSSIETHSLKQLQPPDPELFAGHLLPFMQGYLARSSSPVLQASALIQDPALRIYGASGGGMAQPMDGICPPPLAPGIHNAAH